MDSPSSTPCPVVLQELRIAADPERWTALGFAVADACAAVGGVALRFVASEEGAGIAGWRLAGLRSTELDGLLTEKAEGAPPQPQDHPNGALGIDHVVALTPDRDRTEAALAAAGLELRRRRQAGPMVQCFYRLGPAVLELVWGPDVPAGSARFWGLVVVVAELDGLAARLGDRVGKVRDAVQPGRRIATVRASAGLGLPVALMTPRPLRATGSATGPS